jgi:hypothetical protein
MAACLVDPRAPDQITHTLAAIMRFRLLMIAAVLYRDADGLPEQHDNVIDVVIVQSGEGTLVVGGKMINPKGGGGPGEYLGTSIEGGEPHPLGPGDIVLLRVISSGSRAHNASEAHRRYEGSSQCGLSSSRSVGSRRRC